MDAHSQSKGSTPTSGALGIDMTSNTRLPLNQGQPSSSLLPVRPEPRRAYHPDNHISGVTRRKSETLSPPQQVQDKSTLMLRQAANYASLAFNQPQHHTRVDPTYTAAALPQQPSPATVDVGVKRLSRVPFLNLTNHRKKSAPLTSLLLNPQDRDDVDVYDAPRLSISSAESSAGSEVKTPESSLHGSVSYLDIQGGISEGVKEEEQTSGRIFTEQGNGQRQFDTNVSLPNHRHRQSATTCNPPFVKLHLQTDDFLTSSARQRHRTEPLMESHQQEWRADDEDKSSHVDHDMDQSTPSADPTMQSRSSTIRAKRPERLIRLASARTDDTARPSPPSTSSVPSTAGPTPAAIEDNAFGKARDPMEDAIITKSGHGLLSSSLDSGNDDLAEQITLALNMETPTSPSEDKASHELNRSIASPDSWRSLLPEHDPFFISSETLSSSTSSRAPSFAGPNSAQHRLSFQEHASSDGFTGSMSDSQVMSVSPSDKDGRRLSSESLQSSFSLAGPVAASLYASSNASGSLHDMDGIFSAGGSRAAFAPLQYQYDPSSRSLASPLLQHTKDRDFVRSNSFDETTESKTTNLRGHDNVTAAQEAAYRRHASFSAFDSPSSSQSNVLYPASPTKYGPLIHPDHHDLSRVYSGRLHHSDVMGAASSPERQPVCPTPIKYSSLSSVVKSPASPALSCAMGNEGERQSWPSSRNSLQGWQADVASTAVPRSLVQVLDPYSVNKKLADGMQQPAVRSDFGSVETVPSVVSMSTSTTETNAPVLPADHRLLTTTTLTTLASTTTTLIASPTSTPSDAGSSSMLPRNQNTVPSHLGPSVEQHTPEKPAYNISPLSPASLPFLETRPAPASAELKVETHSTHYTLKTKLPGFEIGGITLATQHHRQLVIVADNYNESDGGHFERRVTFGSDADLRATRADFNGTLLKITVPRVSSFCSPLDLA